MKPQPPKAEEWDFRGIDKDDAALAERYEYGREIPELVAAYRKWKARLISRTIDPERLPEGWRGRSIGEALLASANFEPLPEEVEKFLLILVPDEIRRPLSPTICLAFPEFPSPFLSVNPALRLRRIEVVKANRDWFHQFQSVKAFGGFDLQMELWNKPPKYEHIVNGTKIVGSIDLAASDAAILDDIHRLRRDHEISPRPVPKAPRGRSPFAGLKWLATERLRRHGLSHADANALCASHKRVIKDATPDVAPWWSNAIARCNSRKDYESRGRELFQEHWTRRGEGIEIQSTPGYIVR